MEDLYTVQYGTEFVKQVWDYNEEACNFEYAAVKFLETKIDIQSMTQTKKANHKKANHTKQNSQTEEQIVNNNAKITNDTMPTNIFNEGKVVNKNIQNKSSSTQNNIGMFTLLHQNIRSAKNKIDALVEFICSRKDLINCIALTEHWYQSGHESNINLPGYYLGASYCRTKGKGGSCIYLKDGIISQPIDQIIILNIYVGWLSYPHK
uniref:Uncharacterized protein n=2 Tax=Cacopsylla melanoneura TaxID=428564 RepID=A0A8D8R6C1_9HEMI